MTKKKYRRTMVALTVLLLFFVALFVFFYLWWFLARYPDFDKISRKEGRIPGLDSGISPQGLCVLPENEFGYDFAMSGYISGAPSRVYLIDTGLNTHLVKNKHIEQYVTFTKNGTPIKTHFGGITCTENYLLIASGGEIIRAALSDVYAAVNGGAVEIHDSFETGIGNAFCYVFDGELYAGEFYRPGNYETDASHHLDLGTETNYAYIYIYGIDEAKTGGVADTVPTKVLSVREQVQGIAVTKDKIYLSTSYGLPDSKLFVYPNVLSGETERKATVGEAEIPLYVLSSENQVAVHTLPCMSEEICVSGDRLCILFESMSKKYRYVVHYRVTEILSVALADLG